MNSSGKTGRDVQKAVEHREVYYSAASEASSYFTNERASVPLQFSNPIVCRMMSGHKTMRVGGSAPFAFVPGESMMVPPSMPLIIDFPFADTDNPTTCICFEIERAKFDDILFRLNDARRKAGERHELAIDWTSYAIYRGEREIDFQLDRLMNFYLETNSEYRDLLVDANMVELAIRLLQVQNRRLLLETRSTVPDTGLDAVARYIASQPHNRPDPEQYARIAGMSEATFFRHFRQKFGTTPSRYAHQARIQKAKDILLAGNISLNEVAFEVGFQSLAHFSRIFKQVSGETPGEYAKRCSRSRLLELDGVRQDFESAGHI
ncbi:AraC family transcriptional regulator (plasmid) [Rhizobium sp. CB3060]|uniref:AraC family transcriptional regulator n=1 Tax=Rhizobium sp. CB3060 TaxID=3138255 RepID=UPI0021A3F2DD|nr:AraC family transcriptional regulator [Rhizobium tropici]UWU26086.1 AraC family transcriptional regulator [Rhizobium tropici]